ncbi:MAG: MFS transporter [Desulfobacteraceae bacterium]|nr:MFS transporter [Desulfobacteraceae bacterium]
MHQTVRSNILRLYVIKLSKWLMLTMPIVFLFYRENGLTTHDLFLLKAVYSAAIVCLEIPSGYFGDIWGRKRSLILGSVLGFVGFALYCVSTGFWGFLACEIILGIGQSFISGSDSAMLYDTLQEAKREKEYLKIEGRLISAGNFAEAIAAPLGVLIAVISLRTTFFFQAAVAFSAIPAALTLFEPRRREMTGSTSFKQILRIVRYALFENQGLQATIAYSSIIGTATLTMAWFVQPYFVFLALPLALYGVFIPLLNLTAGVTSMHAYKFERWLGRENTILFIAIGIASGYLTLGLFSTLGALFFLFLFYIIRGIATPILKNHINEITPSEIRATVLSIRSLIIRLAFVILGPFLGWFADRAGLPSTLVAGAGIFLVTGIMTAMFLINAFRGHECLPGSEQPAPGRHLSSR